MRVITLVNSEWFQGIPERQRRLFLRDLFDLAEDKGWTIRIGGEHYAQ